MKNLIYWVSLSPVEIDWIRPVGEIFIIGARIKTKPVLNSSRREESIGASVFAIWGPSFFLDFFKIY